MPARARYTVFDSEIRGFGLRVFPTGKKSWVFEYKSGAGGRRAATKRITIGRADEFTPDEARKIADRFRSMVKIGQDPQADKASERSAVSVRELAEQFLIKHVKPKRKGSTFLYYQDILNRIVLPAIGSRKAKDISRAQIAKIHLDWSHTPFQANRTMAVVASMYSFGAKNGLVPEGWNPALRIEKYVESRRERFLSDDELERIGSAIREAETVGTPWNIDPAKNTKHVPRTIQSTVIGEHAAAALRLLLFTGARVGEVLNLKWSHVDFGRGLLLLPDSKTGRKTIVLNGPALDVLVKLTKVGTFVIAGDGAAGKSEKPRSDLKRPWMMVRKRAGLDGLRLHDLRHNFASFGVGGGMGLPIIGKLLGHTQASTTERYAHLDADPLRRASNAIASTIASAMGEGPSTRPKPL
ncbi:MAG: tyrosine-type recombinase/integrase [Alphaproteobacteria bacterium]|nr:tyrosine-type recombinase/integrase [Alphaproteobacteria bacterium]MBU0804998.1 tyrosine-type recombinase/integrase [Alphaproteobacteria bacterium]MBU0870497.1 tyrosine-type recombinase/integrase [Alphaproteobacteria bacterium]MBU1401828.1 tyrosine-type recombinase/integrase [Alphaproteobacteria bacterium]MBU1591755.1 tyrosine-type recombinase/integrase [Alphaproteobacteria bacterium]